MNPNHIQHWLDDLEHGDDLAVVYYSAPVPIVRDRLDLMGYTLRTSLEAFEEYVKGERQQVSGRSDQQPVEGNEETRALLSDYYTKTKLLLSGLTAESWLAGLEEIRRLDLKPNYLGRYEGPHEDIFSAFHDLANKQICDWAKEYYAR